MAEDQHDKENNNSQRTEESHDSTSDNTQVAQKLGVQPGIFSGSAQGAQSLTVGQNVQYGHPKNADKERAYSADNKEDQKRTENGTVQGWITVVLAGIQLAVAGWQGWLTLKAVQTADKSVRLTRSALVELERPWIFLEVESHNLSAFHTSILQAGGDLVMPEITFRFRNLGRTAAVIREVGFNLYPSVEPPAQADIYWRRSGSVIPPGLDLRQNINVPPGLSGFAAKLLSRKDGASLWFWGEVVYNGPASWDAPYVTRFLWHYNAATNDFGPREEDGRDRNANT